MRRCLDGIPERYTVTTLSVEVEDSTRPSATTVSREGSQPIALRAPFSVVLHHGTDGHHVDFE